MDTLIKNKDFSDSSFKGISSRYKPELLLKEVNSPADLSCLAVFSSLWNISSALKYMWGLAVKQSGNWPY